MRKKLAGGESGEMTQRIARISLKPRHTRVRPDIFSVLRDARRHPVWMIAYWFGRPRLGFRGNRFISRT